MTSMPAERDQPFRLALLIVLLSVAEEYLPDGIDRERLGCYAFLAANPLLVARKPTDPDRVALLLAGFDDRALSYASPAQRYVTGLQLLPGDLVLLVGYGLVTCTAAGRVRYALTERGRELAGQFTAMYAHSYAAAARVVVGRLRRLSGSKLRENMREWLTVRAGTRYGRLDPADVIDPVPDPEATAPTRTAWPTGFPEDNT
jgi:hypothetical protein